MGLVPLIDGRLGVSIQVFKNVDSVQVNKNSTSIDGTVKHKDQWSNWNNS